GGAPQPLLRTSPDRRCPSLAAPRGTGAAPAERTETEATRETGVAVVTMKQLLESGVHFGHQARRWNPKMRRFIFMERNGIHIIDLQQTLVRVEEAYRSEERRVGKRWRSQRRRSG